MRFGLAVPGESNYQAIVISKKFCNQKNQLIDTENLWTKYNCLIKGSNWYILNMFQITLILSWSQSPPHLWLVKRV